MAAYKVRDVVKRLLSEGWKMRNGKGSHRVFVKPGMRSITVPGNSGDDLRDGTYKSIARSAGWTD